MWEFRTVLKIFCRKFNFGRYWILYVLNLYTMFEVKIIEPGKWMQLVKGRCGYSNLIWTEPPLNFRFKLNHVNIYKEDIFVCLNILLHSEESNPINIKRSSLGSAEFSNLLYCVSTCMCILSWRKSKKIYLKCPLYVKRKLIIFYEFRIQICVSRFSFRLISIWYLIFKGTIL